MDGPIDPLATTTLDDAPGAAAAGDRRRLWTPWRMRYVGGGAVEAGCVFCRRLAADDDVRSLILHRGRHAFAIMNLYPYNTGHLMLVPTEHAASPERVEPTALAEMAALVPPTLRALRRVLGCDGFNLGMNVGADAGAGVADHLHEHVVPRWEGDASFMPILASTMVMPELIPVTYAKVRVELARELGNGDEVACVVLDAAKERVLALRDGGGWRLPRAMAGEDEALWRAARRVLGALVGEVEVVGWAGSTGTLETEPETGLVFVARTVADVPSGGSTAGWRTTAEMVGNDAGMVAAAIDNLADSGEAR